MEFDLAEHRCVWGLNHVYFHDAEGHLREIPATWTDFVAPDPFVVVAAGRSCLHVADLLRLAQLVVELRSRPGGECKGNDA